MNAERIDKTLSILWIIFSVILISIAYFYNTALGFLLALIFLIATYYLSGASSENIHNPYIHMARSRYQDEIEVKHYMQAEKNMQKNITVNASSEMNKIMVVCGVITFIVNLILLILLPI